MRPMIEGPRSRATGGFTLLELIAVMIIMGMLAAGLAMSWSGGLYSAEEEADQLKLRIRYTQARAMGSNIPYGIVCTGGQYYQFSGLNTSDRHAFPGAESTAYQLPSGVSATNFVLSFDQWGVPYTNASQGTRLSSDLTITVTESSGGRSDSSSFTVTPVTGFVP